jgi:glutathionylspermidine synthase
MKNIYYLPPDDKSFKELKEKAIQLWKEYDDTYGYATEKISCIKDLLNEEGNFMYMVAMFDVYNQEKLALILSEKTKKEIRKRMISGGAEEQFIVF